MGTATALRLLREVLRLRHPSRDGARGDRTARPALPRARDQRAGRGKAQPVARPRGARARSRDAPGAEPAAARLAASAPMR